MTVTADTKDPTPDLEDIFLVIAPTTAGYDRTKLYDHKTAVDYAARILHGKDSNGNKPGKMFVVKLVSVVERPVPPVEVRPATRADIPDVPDAPRTAPRGRW